MSQARSCQACTRIRLPMWPAQISNKLMTNKRINELLSRRMFFNFLIGLFVYWIIGLFPAKAFAADFSLGVFPPILQIQAMVPTIISKDITVVNASNNVQE